MLSESSFSTIVADRCLMGALSIDADGRLFVAYLSPIPSPIGFFLLISTTIFTKFVNTFLHVLFQYSTIVYV